MRFWRANSRNSLLFSLLVGNLGREWLAPDCALRQVACPICPHCQHVADRLLRTDFTSQLPRRLQTATPTDRQIPIICTDRRGCVLSKETITFSSPQETELGRAPNRVRLSVCGSRLNGFPVTGLVRRLCISVSSSFCLVELTYFDCRHIIRTLSNLLELT